MIKFYCLFDESVAKQKPLDQRVVAFYTWHVTHDLAAFTLLPNSLRLPSHSQENID